LSIETSGRARPLDKRISGVIHVILYDRGVAIVLVVAAHAAISLLAAEVDRPGFDNVTPVLFGLVQLPSPVKTVVLELCRLAVPLFLFFSGYHLARSPRTIATIRNGARRLVVPMLFWSFVGWAMSLTENDGGWTVPEFFRLLITGRTQLGYYFVILILQFLVISIWLVPMIVRRPFLSLLTVVVIQFGVHAYDYFVLIGRMDLLTLRGVSNLPYFPEFLFPRFLVAFSVGIWASTNSGRFKDISARHIGVFSLLTIVLAVVVILETGYIYHYSANVLRSSAFVALSRSWGEWKISTALYTIAGTFLVISLSRRTMVLKSHIDELGKHSYQVLLLHGIILRVLMRIAYKFGGDHYWFGLPSFLTLLVAGLYGPILLAKLIRKYAPARARFLLVGI